MYDLWAYAPLMLSGFATGHGDNDDGDDDGASGDEGDWMDVDDEAGAPTKRAKANSGAVVAKGRQPRSNRQLAGMRDEAVSGGLFLSIPLNRADGPVCV